MSTIPKGHQPASTRQQPKVGHPPRSPKPNSAEPPVLQLQRAAGNSAVAGLLRQGDARTPSGQLPTLQRDPTAAPAPASAADVTALQKKTLALEKRQAATTQDSRWRGLYGEKLSSWKQAIYRVTGGIDAARGGFAAAQAKQAEFDAMVTQLVMAVATVGFAAGFEPLLSGALMTTKIGGAAASAEEKIKAVANIVEKIENPAVSAVSAQANIVGAAPKTDNSPGADSGLGAGTAVGYLATQLESLEAISQRIEHAFVVRATGIAALPDDAASTLDTTKQEGIYTALMQELDAAASGVNKMKPALNVGLVIERHIWASWLQSKYIPGRRGELGYSGPEFDDFGSYTEDRLNAAGVSAQAGVELTGHWYSGNSADYTNKLLTWAKGYAGSIALNGAE